MIILTPLLAIGSQLDCVLCLVMCITKDGLIGAWEFDTISDVLIALKLASMKSRISIYI